MVHPSALSEYFRYTEWATRRLLDFAATVPEEHVTRPIENSHGGILKTFQHIYYADRVWLTRMEGAPVAFEDPDPGPTLAELNQSWWPILLRFQNWAAAQDDGSRVITYKNLKGETYSRTVYHIGLHVVNHGTYHRGQIASMLRQLGHIPPYTDFIYFAETPNA